ncbi:MAG: carboxyl-terminal protease, partial [Synechococcales cyanobacterium]
MTKTLVKIILCPILPVILVVGYWVTPALALTNDQTLIIEAWRIVNRSYVDTSFNHQNWWAVRKRFLEKNVPDRP